MRALVVCAILMLSWSPASVSAQAVPLGEDCQTCHLGLDDPRLRAPADSFPDHDIHAETGFGCLSCHGSGGRGTLIADEGFLTSPKRERIPEMCGRCHSDAAYMRQFNPSMRVDQVLEYWTSTHGRRLAEQGDTSVATCIDCHPAHSIRAVSDLESSVYAANVPATCGRCHSDAQRMAGRGIPTDQVEKHRGSVHGVLLYEGGDVSAPVCNDCHGNHGAAPPGIASVRNVCGQCHSVMADFFDESQHSEAFEDADLPLCATCHDHHDIQPVDESSLNDRTEAVCSRCHVPNDEAGHSFEAMAELIDSLARATEHSRALLEEAEGMGMEVSQALFELDDVGNARTRARSAIHTFHVESVAEEIEAGFEITATAQERAEEAFAEFDFRRVGLGVSAGFILLLIAGLLLKMRHTEEQLEEVMASVRGFFSRALGQRPPSPAQYRLAACTLLLEAAYAAARLDSADHANVTALVRRQDGVPVTDVEELIGVVEQQVVGPTDVGQVSHRIARYANASELDGVVEEFWLLVYSDAAVSRREIELMVAASKLLGCTVDELADMRREVMAGRTGRANEPN